MFLPLVLSIILSHISCQKIGFGEQVPPVVPPVMPPVVPPVMPPSEDKLTDWEQSNDFEGPNRISDVQDNLWPNGFIHYSYSPEWVSHPLALTKLKAYIIRFNLISCVKFTRIQIAPPENHLTFKISKGDEGCKTLGIGMTGGEQYITLDLEHCLNYATVAHHLLHAAGFHHQHQTMNRDEYVQVIWDNIVDEKKHLFQKLDSPTILDEPYDFNSITHYGRYAYTKNGLPTLVSKQGNVYGEAKDLSETDVDKLNRMYQCDSRAPKADIPAGSVLESEEIDPAPQRAESVGPFGNAGYRTNFG